MASIRLDMTDEKLEQIDKLQARSGLATRKDLINEALTVYARFLQIIEDGGSLPFAMHDGIQKEIAAGSYMDVHQRVQRESVKVIGSDLSAATKATIFGHSGKEVLSE